MILDESGLTWHAVQGGMDTHGSTFTEYGCLEYPRLTRLVQRATDDGEYVETYSVRGIANYYRSAAEAIEAMKANP